MTASSRAGVNVDIAHGVYGVAIAGPPGAGSIAPVAQGVRLQQAPDESA